MGFNYTFGISVLKSALYAIQPSYHFPCSFPFGSQKYYFMLSSPPLHLLHHTMSKLSFDNLASFFVEKNRSHPLGTSCFPHLPIYSPWFPLLSEASASCALNPKCPSCLKDFAPGVINHSLFLGSFLTIYKHALVLSILKSCPWSDYVSSCYMFFCFLSLVNFSPSLLPIFSIGFYNMSYTPGLPLLINTGCS